MLDWVKNIFRWFAKKNTRVVSCIVIGLDGAGKSSLLASLVGDVPGQTTPTVGFASEVIQRGKYQLKLFDLGGGESFRIIWERYYAEIYGVIFVTDSADLRKFDTASEVFMRSIQNTELSGKPILVCANKHDLSGSLSVEEVTSRMNLEQLTKSPFSVIATNACRRPIDPNFSNGIDWLLAQINNVYDTLDARVTKDVAEQRAADKIIKDERSKRISVMREERELEELEKKVKRKRDAQTRISHVIQQRTRASSDAPALHSSSLSSLSHSVSSSLHRMYELEQNQALDESLANSLLPPNLVSPSSAENLKTSNSNSSNSSNHIKQSGEIYSKPGNNLVFSEKSLYDSEFSHSGKKNHESSPMIVLPDELPLGQQLAKPKKKENSEKLQNSGGKTTNDEAHEEDDDVMMRRASDLPEPQDFEEVTQKQFFLSTDWPLRKEVLPSIPSIASSTSMNSSLSTSASSTQTLRTGKLPHLSPAPSRSPPSPSPPVAWEKMAEM